MTADANTVADAAMKILLSSGESRALVTKAMEAIAGFDFDGATVCLTKAQQALREAHRVHTDVIQAEARGEVVDVPALFSHAQDTMMTTDSELRLVRRMVPAFRAIADRLTAVERGTTTSGAAGAAPDEGTDA